MGIEERLNEAMYYLARPKMKGVPVKIINGEALFADDKPVPNRMVRDLLGGLPQFVGEIVVGKPEADDCYERSLEFLTDEGLFELHVFWVYDLRTTDLYSLKSRLQMAESFVQTCGPTVQYVDHETISSRSELDAYVDKIKTQGFEDAILRQPFGTFGTWDEEAAKLGTVHRAKFGGARPH